MCDTKHFLAKASLLTMLGTSLFWPRPGLAAGYYNLGAFWKPTAPLSWTWLGGNTVTNTSAIYGTLGTAASGNWPGTRTEYQWMNVTNPQTWTDSSGNLWLFGGNGTPNEALNDLWKYSPSTSLWAWMGGTSLFGQRGIYGTRGTGSTGNLPGARFGGCTGTDSAGNLWLYGGSGIDGAGQGNGELSDLWKYTPSNSQWTWVAGASLAWYSPSYGTRGTGSTNNYAGARQSCGLWLDSSNNVWIYGGYGPDVNDNFGELSDLWKYTPTNSQWTWERGATVYHSAGVYGTQGTGATGNFPGGRNTFTTWKDGSGNFWLYGGYGWDAGGNYSNLGDVWKFTATNTQWTWVAGPSSAATLGNWGTQGTGATGNGPGSRWHAYATVDASNNLWFFGGWATDASGAGGPMNDTWKFSPSNSQWTWVSGGSSVLAPGVYGAQGVSSTSYYPSSRGWGADWKDSSGNLWVLGGVGGAGPHNAEQGLNDLWKFSPSTSQWMWVGGVTNDSDVPLYGTPGVGSTANPPGARGGDYTITGATWVDSANNLWLFGGSGPDYSGTSGMLADLWMYNPGNSQWTYVGGNTTGFSPGAYGTQGSGSTANAPGGRFGPGYGSDPSGNFWLFGGQAVDAAWGQGQINDLWKFNQANSQWTWVSGGTTVNGRPNYGTLGTGSTSNIPGARQDTNGWTDATGNLWVYGGWGIDANGTTSYLDDFWKFTPANSQWTWVSGATTVDTLPIFGTRGTGATSNTPGARESMGTWVDGSGNFWIFGGYGYDATGTPNQLSDLWKFTPSNSQWTWVSGTSTANDSGNYGTRGIGSTGNLPPGRQSMLTWKDANGYLYIFGGLGGPGYYNDVWKFNPANSQWTWVEGASTANALATYGTLGTGSTSNIPSARQGGLLWRDSTGTIWSFGGVGINAAGGTQLMNDFWKAK